MFIQSDWWNYYYYCIIITFLWVTVKMQEEQPDTTRGKQVLRRNYLGKALDWRQGGQRKYLCFTIKLLALTIRKRCHSEWVHQGPSLGLSLLQGFTCVSSDALKDLARLLQIFSSWGEHLVPQFTEGIMNRRDSYRLKSSLTFAFEAQHDSKKQHTQQRASCLQFLSCKHKCDNQKTSKG